MYIYLDIVKQFTCEMCGTCCQNNWLVMVDKNSYDRNARLFATTGRSEEFEKAFVRLEGQTSLGEYARIAKQADGSCWFLAANNLCRLQREAGHDQLDTVCQTFPRYPMSTARGLELTLSFSCPAVVRLASRLEPLQIIRSELAPIAIKDDNCVVAVYPQQQPAYSPLRYYFELENHFIDIVQCRSLSVKERLNLLRGTVKTIHCLSPDDSIGQSLNSIFNHNYDLMDTATAEQPHNCTANILLENFFVNFIFKKVFYIYGFSTTCTLLERMWQYIETAQTGVADQGDVLASVRSAIMELEFNYSHNRQALLSQIYQDAF